MGMKSNRIVYSPSARAPGSVACRLVLLLSGAAFLVLQAGPPAACEDPPPAVERKVDEVAREQEEIKRRLDALEHQAATRDADAAEPRSPEYDFLEQPIGLGLSASYGEVLAGFQFFGDGGFNYRNPPLGASHSSFATGSLDIFITASIAERFQAVSESLVLAGPSDLTFTQQRLYASWVFSDALYAKLGLEHTPTSRWNRVYHHGKWLETTIDRPLLARFEGDDGILAGHFIGLEVGGLLHTFAGKLSYLVIASNGRGITPRDRGTISDRNDDKAVDVALSFTPSCLPALTFGGAARFDNIPPDPPARTQSLCEVVGSAFVEYRAHGLEALAEYVYTDHMHRGGGGQFGHHAAYLQMAYRCGSWVPYTRFDIRIMEQGDPFYTGVQRDLDRWQQVIGIRWDFIDNAAVKLEAGIGREERRLNGQVTRGHLVIAGFQLAWVF
jgi:hypothetical protein